MSVIDTGFVSAEQEQYLMRNEPSLYKAVLKKHGSFINKNKKAPSVGTRIDNRSASLPNVSRGRSRRGGR